MKASLKRKWMKALRSGIYKQGRTVLRQKNVDYDDTYCCLGVLCDISGVIWKDKGDYYGVGEIADIGTPTKGLRRKYGLTDDAVEDLVSLNDDHMFSFRRIATWIEKNL